MIQRVRQSNGRAVKSQRTSAHSHAYAIGRSHLGRARRVALGKAMGNAGRVIGAGEVRAMT